MGFPAAVGASGGTSLFCARHQLGSGRRVKVEPLLGFSPSPIIEMRACHPRAPRWPYYSAVAQQVKEKHAWERDFLMPPSIALKGDTLPRPTQLTRATLRCELRAVQ